MASKNASPAGRADEQFEADVYRALQDEGVIIPVTEEEVVKQERRPALQERTLPVGLLDTQAVFSRIAQKRPRVVRSTIDLEVEQNLARAAREGGNILPEVEARMRRDREEAERDDDK